MAYDLPGYFSQTDAPVMGASVSDTVNNLIDASLQARNAEAPPRDYLGASTLGKLCSRALQYSYTHTSPDQPFSGRTLRIFEMGHAIEGMALNWLTGAGFTIHSKQADGRPFGFSAAGGKIQGHVDGIVQAAPPETGIACPAIWECKSMNARSWKQTSEKGLKASKPAYAVQVALYQAYMEGSIPGVSLNPALFSAVNKDTSEIYHELVPFDAVLAQEASDRGVNILRATQAKETLPRISIDPAYFECRFCDWKRQCWKEGQ